MAVVAGDGVRNDLGGVGAEIEAGEAVVVRGRVVTPSEAWWARSPVEQCWEPIQRVLSSAKSILVWLPSEMEMGALAVWVARLMQSEIAGEESVGLELLASEIEGAAVGEAAVAPPGMGMLAMTGVGVGSGVGMTLTVSAPCWRKVTLAVLPPHSGPQLRT